MILEIIAGFYQPSHGRIFVDGVETADLLPEKRGIGFVYQDYSLFLHMTVYENIAFGLRMQQLSEAEIRSRIHVIMTRSSASDANYHAK
ncbi:MAG: ATP-binding cassette domain-containing protein [Candidatus Hodarchaeota archaeon]